MSDFIRGLEDDLVGAARRIAMATAERPSTPAETAAEHLAGSHPTESPDGPGPIEQPRSWRPTGRRAAAWPLRTVLAACLLAGATATAGAAATLLTLRGSVIPAPAAQDVPKEQTPVPDSARVSELRVADPDPAVPPWTIRVSRGTTGYVCSTVGQIRDGRFGLVGLDGRFRDLDPAAADSCGQALPREATLVGARVFSGRRPQDVRTVVNGVGGAGLRRVALSVGGRTVPAAVGEGGDFVAVLRGYPEDVGLEARLTFADGHHQTERLGRDPALVLDPSGGSAWRTQSSMMSGDARSCVSFSWARRRPDAPGSPGVCGLLIEPGKDAGTRRGAFFAVRRLSGRRPARRFGTNRIFGGDWHDHPARTAVWGGAGDDVRRVTVLGLADGPRNVPILPGQAFLLVLPGSVDPGGLRVRITRKDGTTTVSRGDTNLVDRPVPATLSGRRKP